YLTTKRAWKHQALFVVKQFTLKKYIFTSIFCSQDTANIYGHFERLFKYLFAVYIIIYANIIRPRVKVFIYILLEQFKEAP
ncbi:MAG: hypothetical protein AB1499_14440, partial [Nitrospirota bacterium]